MIHIFHGFLGSPEDFSFLKRDDVIIHDLYEMSKFPDIFEDDILIGYSMGGRIALEMAHSVDYKIKKIVLINAHPGLDSEEARFERKDFESKVLQELAAQKKDDFLEWWNSLPIFNFDGPITTTDERYQKSLALFDRYRLSEQKDHLPDMIRHKDKVLFIAGLFDERYMELVSDLLLPEEITVKGIPGGHRLFQNKEELISILSGEGIL